MTALRFDEPEFLTLRIGGRAPEPERLLLIGPPRAGEVLVRQWTSNTLASEGEVYAIAASALMDEIQVAYDARRSVSEELPRIRQWLGMRA